MAVGMLRYRRDDWILGREAIAMTDNVSVPRLRRIIWKPNATFNDRVRCWAWLNDNNYDVIDAYTCRGVIIYTVTK